MIRQPILGAHASAPLFIALVALASTVAAQRPESRPAPRASAADAGFAEPTAEPAFLAAPSISEARRIARTRVHYDEAEDGVLWARGADFKAKFDAHGATYFPLFGERQIKHVPHSLSPERVTIGAQPIPIEAEACVTRVGDRIEIDRGAFVEAYDMRADAIEQTFVFSSLPRSGEIVVTIPIQSALEIRDAADALEFRGELGRMSYSRAIAVDGAGRRSPAVTQCEDGVISIRVDASFAASAQLPLVIDPVITTFPVDTDAPRNLVADTAYDSTSSAWLVVYEEAATGTDQDVVAATFNLDGTPRNVGFLDQTTLPWRQPRCATIRHTSQFQVVAMVNEVGVQSVRGRKVNGMTHAMSVQFRISDVSEGHCNDPDIGGDPYEDPTSSFYLVVYTHLETLFSTNIVVRTVSPTGTSVGAPTNVTTSAAVQVNPTISKSNGEAEWLIAWQLYVATDDFDVIGRRVRWPLNFQGAPFPIAATSASETTPSVSRALFDSVGNASYMVAHEVLSGTNHDIVVTLLNQSTIAGTVNLDVAENVVPLDRIEPSIDTTGAAHFMLAYTEFDGATSYDVRASEVSQAGGFLEILQSRLPLGVSATPERRPRLCASGAPTESGAGTVGTSFLAVFDDDDTGVNGDVRGALVSPLVGGSKTPFCFGDGSGTACPCGNNSVPGAQAGCVNSFGTAGRLVANGNASTTSDTLVLQATGLSPTGTSATFFQGILPAGGGAGTVFGDGLRCTTGATIRLGSPPASGGSSSYGFGVPGTALVHSQGAVPADGGTRFYQVLYRNAASFCTSATFNTSNGLYVVWTPL